MAVMRGVAALLCLTIVATNAFAQSGPNGGIVGPGGAGTGGAGVSSLGNASGDGTITLAGTGFGPYTGTVTIKCTVATSLQVGCVEPDGTIVTVSGGLITVAKATTSAFGVVEIGTGLSVSGGIVTPTFGTATNQVAEGGVITAGGPTGSATVAPIIAYNAAGQLTAVSSATITPAVGSITGLGTGVATALGGNVNASGGFPTVPVGNAELANPATTVNGQTCALGSICTVTAVASSLTVGTTNITGGTNTRVEYNNSGVLGEYAISGTGSVAMTNSPTITDPTITAHTFAGLPASPTAGQISHIVDGLAANCGDGTCTTPGATVTGGTGSLDLLIGWDGAAWRIFRAQAVPALANLSGTLAVNKGGTNCAVASITCFNNITGYTASGATGTTSTNLVFSTSPTLVTPTLGAATGTSLALGGASIGSNALAVNGTVSINLGTLSVAGGYFVQGTIPAVISSTFDATQLQIATAGSSSFVQRAMRISLTAGYTGNALTAGLSSGNSAAGTADVLIPPTESINYAGNVGITASSIATAVTTALNVGTAGHASNGSDNSGVLGLAQISTTVSNGNNIGGTFTAYNAGPGTISAIGVYATLAQQARPSGVISAILADTGAMASGSVFIGRVGGVTKFTIDQNGNVLLVGTLTGADSGTWGSGGINGSAIGATTPSTGKFTVLTASTSFAAGGCTIGSNALCATGGVSLNGVETILSGGNIGFGTETNPQSAFVVSQNTTTGIAAPTASQLLLIGVNSTAFTTSNLGFAAGGAYSFFRADGTAASPTALALNDNIGAIGFGGYNGAAYVANKARILGLVTDASGYGAGTQGTGLEFDTTASGGTSRAQAGRFMAGFIVGTGTTDPGAGQLAVTAMTQTSAAQSGTVCYSTTIGALTYDATLGCLTSLEELKDIHGPITGALAEVVAMNPFWFSPINRPAGSDLAEQPGFGAHQIEAIDKRLVGYDDKGNLRGVRYMEMTAVLAAAIKELKADNDNLHEEVQQLRRSTR